MNADLQLVHSPVSTQQSQQHMVHFPNVNHVVETAQCTERSDAHLVCVCVLVLLPSSGAPAASDCLFLGRR